MGIPSYFSYIIKNHHKIMKEYSNSPIHELYFDSNSIIYDSIRNILKNELLQLQLQLQHQKIYQTICLQIEMYIKEINPTELVYISFDGIAPFAKLNQQRERRFKGQYTKEILKNVLAKPSGNEWDTCAITPGTSFMKQLDIYVNNHFKNYPIPVIFTGSRHCGEGEHKIMQHIRNTKNTEKNAVIYGLDADLIMLGLNHLSYRKNIFLYRETPEFIKNIRKSLEPNKTYLLDMKLLGQQTALELAGEEGEVNYIHKMYDYIFMCFMLGNDFMPHFPSVNIRTDGIYYLIEKYRGLFKNNDCLYDGEKIHWKNVRKLIQQIALEERQLLILEHKKRVKAEKKHYPTNNDEEREFKFLNIPTKHRQIEKYINPYEAYWEERYYKMLFDTHINDTRRQEICINYIQGLEWNMEYYTKGCIDWNWYYKYDYPPLFSDLIKHVPNQFKQLLARKPEAPVSNFFQLSYVLPKKSLYLLPANIKKRLLETDWYVDDCEFKWSYCKYFWESHPVLPDIQPKALEQILAM